MSKAVVCILVATALVILIVTISQNAKHNNHQYHNTHYGLSRRVGINKPTPVFDPLVTKVQRKAEEKASKNKKLKKDDEADKQYYNDDGTLNLRLRLMVLFPFLDTVEQDGMIDSKELEAWLMQQAVDRLHYRTWRELELHDKDGDGAISFSEYLPQFSDEDIERNDMRYGEAGWWMEQFRNADVDKNGTLNLYEFRDFLHPEDSRNEQIHKWLLREKIRHMDKNNDQKLDLMEFEHGAYHTYKTYVEYESGGEHMPAPEDVFNKLDVDKDRLLRLEELKPIIQYLSPGELAHSKYFSNYLIQEADDNRDGKLTLEEMIKHECIFYNTIYENPRYDDESGVYHDEL